MNTIAATAWEHVEHLAVRIGSRAIGSAANLEAAAYISGIFEERGLSVETQDFPCPDWTEEHTTLELDGEPLDAFANTFSPSCDLRAATLPVCTVAELESAAIRGCVLIFYGDLAQSELAAERAIYVPPRDRRILDLLKQEKPAAIITVNPTLHERWRLVEDFDLDIPSATVTAHSGLRLLRKPGAMIHLCISATRSPSHSANLIATQKGATAHRIVLCAHYDTKVDTPGAYDNAAGVGVLLASAQALSRRRHRHTIEWIAFSGEEGYGLGDMEYARRCGGAFAEITVAMNFDGVGPFTGTTTVASFEASQSMDALLCDTLRRFPAVARVDPWPASDHYIFYSRGVPSLAFTSRGIRDIHHTPSDSLEWISGDKLEESLDLALQFVDALDERQPAWTRPAK